MARIAFIGLGTMGLPMSINLVKAGHDVTGFDLVPERIEQASDGGVRPAESCAEAARNAEFVFTMLPAGQHVRAALTGDDGVFTLAGRDFLIIDSSTTDLETTRFLHGTASEQGLRFLDAPVSGGVTGAEAGTLTFMAGGDAAAIDSAEPLLLVMGRKVVRAGGPSCGQVVKLCNNLLLGVSMIGVCEAIALGEAAGLDHQVLFDVISTSSGSCWSMNVNCPMPGMVPTSPANRDFQAGFSAQLMLKDLTLAQAAASQTNASTPLGEHARQLYERFCENLDGDLDFSAMIQLLRNGR